MTDTVPGRVHPHLLGAEALHRQQLTGITIPSTSTNPLTTH
jgi:hypothetical protein